MAGRLRTMLRALPTTIVMMVAAAGAPDAGAAPNVVPAADPASTWAIGDCYADADDDTATVDLSSKIGCAKDHDVQVIGGGPLPPSLATMTRAELIATTGAEREALDTFADETCAPRAVVRNVYGKKTGKALAELFDEYDVSGWIPPAAGTLRIFLPDTKAFDAGAADVLCGFVPDASFSGSTAGDVRRVGTRDPLESLRVCFRRSATAGTDLATCDDDHDYEGLIWLEQHVPDLPVDTGAWSDADWAGFDEMCDAFAPVLVGATRTDLSYRANTQPSSPPVDGYRFVYCEAFPTRDGAALPGGTTVNGIGTRKIAFARA